MTEQPIMCCICGKTVVLSPPIPEGRRPDPGETYTFGCPEHGPAYSAMDMYRQLKMVTAERDEAWATIRDINENLVPGTTALRRTALESTK